MPRSSGALGFAQYLPQEMSLFSKEAILDKIAVALGGRAAEELFVKRVTTGAADDLDKVSPARAAIAYVTCSISNRVQAGILNIIGDIPIYRRSVPRVKLESSFFLVICRRRPRNTSPGDEDGLLDGLCLWHEPRARAGVLWPGQRLGAVLQALQCLAQAITSRKVT